MTPYTFSHVTPATLDAYADFRNIENREDFRARLSDGRLTYEQLRQMHSGRGLEAAWADSQSPVIFPKVQLDLQLAGLDALAGHLAQTSPDKRVILNEGMAPTGSAPWLAAGWLMDIHAVMASTDLTTGSWPLDPRVQVRPVTALLAPDLLELYAELVKVGMIGDTGQTDPAIAFKDDLQDVDKQLFVLLEGAQVLAAALLFTHGRGAGIHMLGVRPDWRGRGLGLALHAHLLAVAALTHSSHGGATDFDNLPMRLILERNGALLVEQKQFIRPT